MAALFSVLALSLSALSTRAAPTPENIALARKYAPEFRFHQDETYWPSTVEYYLQSVHLEDSNGNRPSQPSPLSLSNLDDVQSQGSGLFLTSDINSGKGSFLRGQNPSTSSTKPATYTFVVPKSNGVVDLYYWQFCPFNEGKSVPLVGEVGDHTGDWERITVRTVNGIATQVDYHAHSDTGSGTIPWEQVIKFDNGQRPAAYVAKGSHGFWSSAGTNTYVNAIIFKLQDLTSDSGVHWDSKDSIVPLSYPDSYPDNLGWLNFKGAWGNRGTTSCWWHFIYAECEIVDGPTGPVRDDVLSAAVASVKAASIDAITTTQKKSSKYKMDGPLSQTLGTVSATSESSYIVRLASAPALASQFLTVEQRCGVFNETSQETVYTSSTFSSSPLAQGSIDYTLAVPACADDTLVMAYAAGLCSGTAVADSIDDVNCTFAPARALRAYQPGVMGFQQTTAVAVDDLDDWTL